MLRDIKEELLTYTNYLMLQGPKGFFFFKLSKFLKKCGKRVYKINFNGGDLFTFPSFRNVFNYRGKLDNFEEYLEKIIHKNDIDAVLLYGDYKPYHKIAVNLCRKMKIAVYIFEEGYIRPYYITLQKNGINGWSGLSKDPDFYRNLPEIKIKEPFPTNFSYLKRVISSVTHYFFLELLRWYFPHYVHCKKYFPYLPWISKYFLGIIRKFIYGISEKKLFFLLTKKLKHRYFLVPLQVHNDTQITIHSKYQSIEEFITEVLESFSKKSCSDHYIVFKHHPEDRGFKNYKKYIRKVSERLNIKDRVFYVHDLHLPTLIKGSIGVIVINSTVGLQALYHNRPVKVMGKAIYDIPGLTFQGKLDQFWSNPGKIDKKLYEKFRNFIIKRTQLNGNYYGRFPFERDILFSISSNTVLTDSSKVNR